MTDARTCPKCGQTMTRGFIADRTGTVVHISHWVEGAPRPSFWMKTKAPADRSLPIASFRCTGCGLLESYADAAYGPQR